MTRKARIIASVSLGALLVAGGTAFTLRSPRQADAPSAEATALAEKKPLQTTGATCGVSIVSEGKGVALPPALAGTRVADFGWGSGEDRLGLSRPSEGLGQAPASFAVDRRGNTVVVDQVNDRLVRVDPDGKVQGSIPLTVRAAQDVLVTKDGTMLVMDRLADKSIAILGPDGKLRGELALQGKNLPEPGLITGMFLDGDSLYAEREAGTLFRVGDLSGTVDPEQPEIPGRPTRDGRSYIHAALANAESGRVLVTALSRDPLAHRYSRQLELGMTVRQIKLADTDQAGVIYLALVTETPAMEPGGTPKGGMKLLCLDPLDGRPMGQRDLPVNDSPEDTFNELRVLDEGGVIYAVRSETGMSLVRYSCG